MSLIIKVVLVEADKSKLGQVILNLLNNALKFTKAGSITIRSEKKDDSTVLISIIDTGQGINLDILPKLFVKYTSQSDRGTGLGLFICKTIVEAHGGRICAEKNSDGKGTTFTFSLPLDQKAVK